MKFEYKEIVSLIKDSATHFSNCYLYVVDTNGVIEKRGEYISTKGQAEIFLKHAKEHYEKAEKSVLFLPENLRPYFNGILMELKTNIEEVSEKLKSATHLKP